MSADAVEEHKTRLRKTLLERRDRLGETSRSDKNRAIQERLKGLDDLKEARTVFCFISHGHEPDTRRLLDWLLDQGKQVFVPRVVGREEIRAVAFTGWEGLNPGPLGILAPASTAAAEVEIDVCITPGIGFSMDGRRLGHGAGYYDRWFAGHDVRRKIAPIYECQLHGGIPVREHDVPVDTIVTEDRVIDTRSSDAGRS